MNKNKVAVIMTVHNRKEKTIRCLKKLFENDIIENDIICYLTDDGCTDGTAESVINQFPNVVIIEGDGTLFWNRGMYKAWNRALQDKPDYFLWLNDDTLLEKTAVSCLIDIVSKYQDEAIIVGSTCDSYGELSYGGRQFPRKHNIIVPDSYVSKPCSTFNGNIVLVPNKVVDKIGIIDPYFRHSFGDIEYGLRATKNGIRCIIAPGFLGKCNRNNPIPLFRRKQYSLLKRYKLLYSPLGFNPIEDFYLNKKYYPLWKCLLWYIKLHLNVLFSIDHTKYN